MGKSWKDNPHKNYKQQKHRKKEKAWNTKNHISVRRERDNFAYDNWREYEA